MAERPLTLIVRAPSALGRNDTIANATPLSSGFFRASISPLADPPNVSSANPDVDVFKLTADPGATVQVEGLTGGITPPSALDPVLEIVDENGVRLNLCSNSIFNQNGPFNQPCMNDDFVPGSPEAKLLLRVPSNAAAPLAFYVRVLDFRGDARPDFLYDLRVLGAN